MNEHSMGRRDCRYFKANLRRLALERYGSYQCFIRSDSDRLALSESTRSHLLSGERNPTLDTLLLIADFFHVSPDSLVLPYED